MIKVKATTFVIMWAVLALLLAFALVHQSGKLKQAQMQIEENEMWFDFMESKISDLQKIADETQRECIDLLHE